MNQWLEEIQRPHLKPRTFGTYRSVIDANVIPSIGAVRLNKLEPSHIRLMEQWITQGDSACTPPRKAKSASTAAFAYRVTKTALDSAVQEGLIDANPCARVKSSRVDGVEVAVLSPAQAGQMIRLELDSMWHLMWRLAFALGMRQGERLGLTGGEIEERDGVVGIEVRWQSQHLTRREVERVPAGVDCEPLGNGMYRTRPKTQAGRRWIPLPPDIARELLEYVGAQGGVDTDDLVFTNSEGMPLTPRAEQIAWARAYERLGLGPYVPRRSPHPHSARHTTASIMARLGMTDAVRTQIMGHSRVSTTDGIYTHVDRRSLETATSGVQSVIEGQR